MAWFKRILFLLVLGGIAAGGIAWYRKRDKSDEVQFRTVKVSKGEILATISATGIIQPEEVVDVGAQVTGQIIEFGTDVAGNRIDNRSEVVEDQLLARIDDVPLQAERRKAQAAVTQADASVKRAKADVVQQRAKLQQAERDWERAKKLGPSDIFSQAQYDAAQAAYESAAAMIDVADASVAQAEAQVESAKADLAKRDRDINYTIIKSPVTGTVIQRRVNIGQTIVSSQSASSMFLIATDLRRIQLWIAVNEADIGNIYPGQPVTFTVDTFPNETFKGVVKKVRLDATMTQNVVTYTVEVSAENPDLRLMTYMTANVKFEVARREDVFTVPNAALRFTPKPEQVALGERDKLAAAMQAGPSGGGERRGGRRGGGSGGGGMSTTRATTRSTMRPTTRPGREMRPEMLWVREGQHLKPIAVKAGVSDTTNTEVAGPDLKEGMEIITGEMINIPGQASGTNTNPFAPQFRRGGSSGGRGGGR